MRGVAWMTELPNEYHCEGIVLGTHWTESSQYDEGCGLIRGGTIVGEGDI